MYYVYELVDPNTGEPFYIGKGKGRRMHQHERDARKGASGRKCDRIRELIDMGLRPEARIIKRFSVEKDAYAFEAELIATSRDSLLNIAPGGGGCIVVDPVAAAKKLVLRFHARFRQAIELFRSGTSVSYDGCDFVVLAHNLAMANRDKVGAEFFDKHVWGS